jgi:hypothetical protein
VQQILNNTPYDIHLPQAGPATVVCDYMTLTFMFLSVVTSNIIATALAKQVRVSVV